jgi:hypothetical protein
MFKLNYISEDDIDIGKLKCGEEIYINSNSAEIKNDMYMVDDELVDVEFVYANAVMAIYESEFKKIN